MYLFFLIYNGMKRKVCKPQILAYNPARKLLFQVNYLMPIQNSTALNEQSHPRYCALGQPAPSLPLNQCCRNSEEAMGVMPERRCCLTCSFKTSLAHGLPCLHSHSLLLLFFSRYYLELHSVVPNPLFDQHSLAVSSLQQQLQLV